MVGVFTMLDSKVLYVGGHPHATRLGQGIIVTNYFKGCLKKVCLHRIHATKENMYLKEEWDTSIV